MTSGRRLLFKKAIVYTQMALEILHHHQRVKKQLRQVGYLKSRYTWMIPLGVTKFNLSLRVSHNKYGVNYKKTYAFNSQNISRTTS